MLRASACRTVRGRAEAHDRLINRAKGRQAIPHTGVLLLVPADPLRSRRPDEHFAAEAAAAGAAGIVVALIDHDALTGGSRAVAGIPDACQRSVPAGLAGTFIASLSVPAASVPWHAAVAGASRGPIRCTRR